MSTPVIRHAFYRAQNELAKGEWIILLETSGGVATGSQLQFRVTSEPEALGDGSFRVHLADNHGYQGEWIVRPSAGV